MKRLFLAVSLCWLALSVKAGPNDITPESVTAQMNVYRAEAGLPPLHLDSRLTRAAEDRMRDMEDGQWWSHQAPDGTSPFIWLTLREYEYIYAGENLAAGFETAPLLVEAWIESPGHRENILGVQFADCGVAVIDGSTKGPSIGKSVVVLFARRKVTMVSVAGNATRP